MCGGDAAIGERFFGSLDGGRAALCSDGAVGLDLTVGDGGANGTFSAAGGTPTGFSTASATGAAGLYFADGIVDGEVYGAGWIALADGTQTGTQTRDRRDHRAAPSLNGSRVVVVRSTRPPTTLTPQPTTPRLEGGVDLESHVPVRVVDQAGFARARLCAPEPARCT